MSQTTYTMPGMRLGQYEAEDSSVQSASLDATGGDVIRMTSVVCFNPASGDLCLPASGSSVAANVRGIAVRDIDAETISYGDTKPEYEAGDTVAILTWGVVQAYVEEAVNPGDALSFRISGANGTTTFVGGLAKTTDAARLALPGVKALDKLTAAGLCRVMVSL